MKKFSGIYYVIFLLLAFITTQVFTPQEIRSRTTESFAPTVCPAPASNGVLTATLPSKKIEIHDVIASKKPVKFKPSGTITRPISKAPLLITGNSGTTFAIQTKTGVWTSGAICTAGISDSWFVGGSADISSQSVLSLVNSGLSDAIIDITAFSNDSQALKLSYTVKQSSQRNIRLDSISPGSSATVLHMVVRTGRVTSYLFDERKKGLKTLGGDFVNAQVSPATDLYIGGVPTYGGKGVVVKHVIRLMTTGDVASTATVQIANSKSVFNPIGLNAIFLKPNVVREVELTGELGKEPLGIKISADQKIVSSIYTYFESKTFRDFLWSTPSQSEQALAEGPIIVNIGGLEPTLTLVSEKIDATVSWTNTKGKTVSKSFRTTDLVQWKIPPNTRKIVIEKRSGGSDLIGGGFTWRNGSGIAFIPLKAGALIDRSNKPISNAATIS